MSWIWKALQFIIIIINYKNNSNVSLYQCPINYINYKSNLNVSLYRYPCILIWSKESLSHGSTVCISATLTQNSNRNLKRSWIYSHNVSEVSYWNQYLFTHENWIEDWIERNMVIQRGMPISAMFVVFLITRAPFGYVQQSSFTFNIRGGKRDDIRWLVQLSFSPTHKIISM